MGVRLHAVLGVVRGRGYYSFTERLAEHLGYSERDPHGAPIPAADGSLPIEDAFPLSRAEAGRRVRVLRVTHEGAPALAHLGERNLVPGNLLTVEEARTLDGVVTVRGEDGTSHSIGQPLASVIFVQSFLDGGARASIADAGCAYRSRA